MPSIPFVYVSRSQQRGGILGEAYLERVFEQAGGLAIRPEELPLERQMEIYSGARKLVFCEGSAVHGLQLLGRLPSEVIILKRRDRPFGTEIFPPRVQALHYTKAGSEELRFDLSPAKNELRSARDKICVNSEKFLATMDKLGIPISKYWNEKEYCRAAEEDILEGTDRFVQAWSKNKSGAVRDEFISLVRASKFAYMAPRLEKRFSDSE